MLIDVDNISSRRINQTLGNIRQEKYSIISYLGEELLSFRDFINRPDPKQEYVSQWQIDFNNLHLDLRIIVQIRHRHD